MKKRPRSHRAAALATALACLVAAQPCVAADPDPFFELELKEVLNLEITSVSRKPQTVSQAAAAVFVITADDIRRSGARTIPEALRMVPGIQVGQISSSVWAVSARGMDGRFTNKLLVLVDGRSVYTPTFSGVYWDVQDTVLPDIERIEVIRGPGASLWGANAVNGVINIITKSAVATQGGLVALEAGDEERFAGSLRYGGKLGESIHWRMYAKGFRRDASVLEADGSDGHDDWRQRRIGFRIDAAPGTRDSVTVQGDYYDGRAGESSLLNRLTPPFNLLLGTTQRARGYNVLGRWQREISPNDSLTLQGYVDHTYRDWPGHLREKRDTYDVEAQYRTRRFAGHDLVVGAGYRVTRDDMAASFTGVPANILQFATFSPARGNRELASAFVQDDITLVAQQLILTLGTKLEHNGFTGFEHQPNARLLWTPGEATTLWASVARAVRTPSRIDREGTVDQTVLPPLSARNPLPRPVLIQATGDVGTESLLAYEAGWKQRVTPTLSVDLALFYNDYRDLRTGRFVDPLCMPSGRGPVPACLALIPGQTYVLQPSPGGNLAESHTYGAELAADWRALPNLRFQLALTQFQMVVREQGNAFSTDREGSVPEHQVGLRMAWNPLATVDVDLWLRHVGKLTLIAEGLAPVPAYHEADLRIAWRPVKGLELALVGRNLLHKRHKEFASELLDVAPMLIERSVHGQLTWKF